MEPEAPSTVQRPRKSLLVLLGIVLVAAVAYTMWPQPAATPAGPPSNQRRGQKPGEKNGVDPADLSVRLDNLKTPRPPLEDGDRNPFRFQPKPAPPPPPETTRAPVVVPPPPPVDTGPPPVPPPPPITVKFIGIMEGRGVGVPGGKIAVFSDCRAQFYGIEGKIVDGRWRLVKIGVESVTLEYPDGRGRTTIRMSGQECVQK